MNRLDNGLSVVMIAKNAGRYLHESLSSLSGIADEIVFIDTGSTDETIEIAQKHACRIFSFPWCDDFSRAKNFGIEQARYRWILNVDSDEIVDGNDARAILGEALRNGSAPAYIVFQDNLCDSGEVIPRMTLRLFQNDPRIRFANPVHECISEKLFSHWPGFFPALLNVHLKHYGCLSINIPGKLGRNNALLQRWIAAEPDNIIGNYKVGCSLVAAGRKEESLMYLEKAFRFFTANLDLHTLLFLPVFALNYHHALVSAGNTAQARLFEQVVASGATFSLS